MLKKGFTLIELLVSIGIFAVVMIVALGALLSMVEASRKAQTLNTVINNLNFALESMTRQIRTGYDYKCGSPSGNPCITTSAGDTYLAMTASDGVTKVAYCFEGGRLKRHLTTGTLASSCSDAAFLPLTAPDVVIESFKFYVVGVGRSPDVTQPRVTVLISGYVLFSEGQRTQFNIQTVLTQRIYDQ